jgi:hypothetical protein
MHRVFFVASGRDSYSKSCANDDAGFDFIAFRSRFATVTMDVGNRIITISNEVGHLKSVQLCFNSFCTHSYIAAVPLFASAGDAPQFSGCSPCPAYELGSYRSSTRCCPLAISPITCDHDDFFELPDCSMEAGSLFTLSGHASAGPLVMSDIPAQTLPLSCPAFPRRQNSW